MGPRRPPPRASHRGQSVSHHPAISSFIAFPDRRYRVWGGSAPRSALPACTQSPPSRRQHIAISPMHLQTHSNRTISTCHSPRITVSCLTYHPVLCRRIDLVLQEESEKRGCFGVIKHSQRECAYLFRSHIIPF
jgi:hypothetical protein